MTNAVQSANKVVDALNGVSNQLAEASKNIRKNTPAIANAATNVVMANSDAMAPFIGATNAAILRNLPKSVVNTQVKTAVGGAVNAIQNASVAANNAAKAIQEGLKQVNKGAEWVEKNASKVDVNSINNAVRYNATNMVNAGRNGLNAVANANIPAIQLNANVTAKHVNAVKNVAKSVKNMVGGKSNRKQQRKNTRKNVRT